MMACWARRESWEDGTEGSTDRGEKNDRKGINANTGDILDK